MSCQPAYPLNEYTLYAQIYGCTVNGVPQISSIVSVDYKGCFALNIVFTVYFAVCFSASDFLRFGLCTSCWDKLVVGSLYLVFVSLPDSIVSERENLKDISFQFSFSNSQIPSLKSETTVLFCQIQVGRHTGSPYTYDWPLCHLLWWL